MLTALGIVLTLAIRQGVKLVLGVGIPHVVAELDALTGGRVKAVAAFVHIRALKFAISKAEISLVKIILRSCGAFENCFYMF
jgi:hypothetical protein